jgi:ArsR family transcriptional regulator
MPATALPTRRRPAAADADLCDLPCVDEAAVARARRAQPPGADIEALAETFRALGDPTRLRLVAALAREELCVCDLAALTGVSQSAVSHSLRALRQLRLVRHRREGKVAYYSLDDAHIARIFGEGLRHVQEPADAGR